MVIPSYCLNVLKIKIRKKRNDNTSYNSTNISFFCSFFVLNSFIQFKGIDINQNHKG